MRTSRMDVRMEETALPFSSISSRSGSTLTWQLVRVQMSRISRRRGADSAGIATTSSDTGRLLICCGSASIGPYTRRPWTRVPIFSGLSSKKQ